MRRRHEQRQPHVRDRGFRMHERLQAKRENDRCPPAGTFAFQAPAPSQKQDCGQRGCDGRWKARRKIVLAENAVAQRLTPVRKRRLIEAILIVEKRNDVIAALQHLARCLGKARLIAIDQRQAPRAREMKKQAAEKEESEIADCRLQSAIQEYWPMKDKREVSA